MTRRPLPWILLLLIGLLTCIAAADAQVASEPLPAGAIQRLGTQRLKFGGVQEMLYLPDGRAMILIGSTLEIWDMAQGSRLETQKLPSAPVSMQLKRDGKTLLLADSLGTVREWDVAGKRELRTVATGLKPVRYAALSPDEQRVVLTVKFPPSVHEFDLTTGKETAVVKPEMAYTDKALYLSDGRTIVAAGGYEHTLEHWDLAKGELLAKFGPAYCTYDFVMSPDGKRLLAGGRTVGSEYDLDTHKALMQFKGHHGGAVTSQTYCLNPDELLTGSRDGSIRKWNRVDGMLLLRWFPHSSYCSLMQVSPDGKWVLSYGGGGFVTETSLETGKPRLTWDRHGASVEAVAFSPSGEVVSGSSDATARVWDAVTGKTLRTLQGAGLGAYSIAISPDGKRIAAGCKDGVIREYGSDSDAAVRELKGHRGYIRSLAYTPDGRLISSADDGSVRVWTEAPDAAVTLHGHRGGVLAVLLLPGGKQVATAGRDGTVRLWDLATGKQLWSAEKHRGWVSSLAYDSQAKEIISAGRDGRILRWNDRGEVVGEMNAGGWISALAVVPQSRRLYTAVGSEIQAWDLSTHASTAKLTGHLGKVTALAASPDGKSVVSASDDTTLLVWDVK